MSVSGTLTLSSEYLLLPHIDNSEIRIDTLCIFVTTFTVIKVGNKKTISIHFDAI